MIASLYQSGSDALAIFFTRGSPSLFDSPPRLTLTGGFGFHAGKKHPLEVTVEPATHI